MWQKAHLLALDVRRASRGFPRSGYTALKSQTVGAAESVVFNIVEGCGATSRKEFARFLDISIKSTLELECQLELAKDYGVLAERAWRSLTADTVEVRRMVCGLRRAILNADNARKLSD